MKRVLGIVSCLLLALALTACGPAVPDFTGMTKAEAQAAVKAAGLTVGEVSYYESSVAAPGTVVAQDPEAGARASAGSRVALTIAGPGPVAAPAVGGMDTTSAVAALTAAGLNAVVEESFSTTAPAGSLISQTPAPGASTPRGSTVKVVVSKGPEPGRVPDVLRKTETDARTALVAAGYKVTVSTRANSAATGSVIAQTPSGGTIQAGGTVRIVVSGGVVPAQVNLLGNWKGSDGTAYEFRAGNRAVTPGGGVQRYRLSGNELLLLNPARPVTAVIKWVSGDRFTLKVVKNGVPGPAVTYDRMK